MSDTRRQQIIDNVRTTLEGILVTSGYNYDVTRVYEGAIDIEQLTRLPGTVGIAFGELPERYNQLNNGRLQKELKIAIESVIALDTIVGDDEVRAKGRLMLADLEKALMADHTRGNLANDTLLEENNIDGGEAGNPYLLVQLAILIRYPTSLTDPTTV